MDHTQLCFAFHGLAVTERGLSFLMCSDVSLLFAVVCPSFLLSTTTNWYIPSSTLMAPWHQRAQFAPYIRRCRPTTPVHPEFKDLRLHQTTTHNKWGCWGGGDVAGPGTSATPGALPCPGTTCGRRDAIVAQRSQEFTLPNAHPNDLFYVCASINVMILISSPVVSGICTPSFRLFFFRSQFWDPCHLVCFARCSPTQVPCCVSYAAAFMLQ